MIYILICSKIVYLSYDKEFLEYVADEIQESNYIIKGFNNFEITTNIPLEDLEECEAPLYVNGIWMDTYDYIKLEDFTLTSTDDGMQILSKRLIKLPEIGGMITVDGGAEFLITLRD